MRPGKRKRISFFIGISLLCIVCILAVGGRLYYYLWIVNPLPSDEQMIENFKAHREDFVEAVRRYRHYPRPKGKDTSRWYLEGDTLEVYRRAGIDRIQYGGTGIWLKPYSVQTAKWVHEVYTSRRSRDLGLPFKYSALCVTPASTPRIDHPNLIDASGYRKNSYIYGTIWKDYYFYPQIPRIENGELLGPLKVVGKNFPGAQYHKSEEVATSQSRERVFPSLNHLPSRWKTFECVYRQIEPQWFLRMCNGR